MQTIVLERPGCLTLTSRPKPVRGPEEALVRVCRVGICGTDLHAFKGDQPFFDYPRVLGHELGVEVLAVPEGEDRLTIGTRCAVEPYLNCGICIACRQGFTNCCSKLQVLGVHRDGGMLEYLTVPSHKLHPSKSLSTDQLALVETLSIGAHAVKRAQLRPSETVLVLGLGAIGLSVIQFVRLAGSRLLAFDINLNRLEFARKKFGVAETILSRGDDEAEVRRANAGELPTVVFDATGNPQSMNQSFNLVAPRGRLVFVGLHQQEVKFKDAEFHRRELTLLASRNSTSVDFSNIITLMEAGQIQVDSWITHRVSHTEIITEFPSWLSKQSELIKAIVEW